MELKLILLQLCAHLLADFSFQTENWTQEKRKKIITKYHFYHILFVFVLSYALSFDFGFWFASIVITVLHFFTDLMKSKLIIRNEKSKSKQRDFFILDQLIHLIVLISVSFAYVKLAGANFWYEFDIKTIAIITGFILCTKPANVIIRHIFEAYDIKVTDDNENPENGLPNAGRLIGTVERLLALALIILGQYEAVGLIIAAKSLLRFNTILKSEYVLIGTLLSFSIAGFTGILISLL